MSQPFNRFAEVPRPRELDERLHEWWVESPWRIPDEGFNLSSYERNRVFLNVGGRAFHDISALTGADSDGDGRAVVGADFTGDGMPDLLFRQAGGGPLLYFENRLPKARWLEVSLRGTKSNSLGIGARITAETGGRRIVRELYPANGFMSQGPARVHFGLGEARVVERLIVRWPSGHVQQFDDVAADRHVRITEDSDEIVTK